MNSNESILDVGKLTIKSQVTIPKIVRSKLGLNPGDRIIFVEKNGEIVIRKA